MSWKGPRESPEVDTVSMDIAIPPNDPGATADPLAKPPKRAAWTTILAVGLPEHVIDERDVEIEPDADVDR
jgi:hypothetical protein